LISRSTEASYSGPVNLLGFLQYWCSTFY